MQFITQLAAARGAAALARKALADAEMNVKPLDPELANIMISNNPQRYALYLRQVADIADTLPQLSLSSKAAEQNLEPLQAQACFKCDGSGLYGGPTHATRNGVPYCFKCNGTGRA